jgi:hypothetical protein
VLQKEKDDIDRIMGNKITENKELQDKIDQNDLKL